MFGMGSWNRGSYGRRAGLSGMLARGGIGRAAVLGLGMMAYRYWRSRQAPKPAAPSGGNEQAWAAGSSRPVTP